MRRILALSASISAAAARRSSSHSSSSASSAAIVSGPRPLQRNPPRHGEPHGAPTEIFAGEPETE